MERRASGTPVILGVLVMCWSVMALADTPGTTLTVTPNTNLNPSGQVVQVSGTGFGASGTGTIVQCIPIDASGAEDCSESLATFTTNASGAFGGVSVSVASSFTAAGSPRTCSSTRPR